MVTWLSRVRVKPYSSSSIPQKIWAAATELSYLGPSFIVLSWWFAFYAIIRQNPIQLVIIHVMLDVTAAAGRHVRGGWAEWLDTISGSLARRSGRKVVAGRAMPQATESGAALRTVMKLRRMRGNIRCYCCMSTDWELNGVAYRPTTASIGKNDSVNFNSSFCTEGSCLLVMIQVHRCTIYICRL